MSAIKTGDRIRCTGGVNGEVFETTALSEPHLNLGDTFRGDDPWLVVSVQPDGWEHPINWPLDLVVPVSGDQEGTADA